MGRGTVSGPPLRSPRRSRKAIAGLRNSANLCNFALGPVLSTAALIAARGQMRTLLAIALLAAPLSASAQTFSGSALAGDGDSLSVSGISIRLFGIDAPELSQSCTRNGTSWPCGSEAKSNLQAMLEGKRIECRGRGIDDFGRTLAVCSANGSEINSAMVAQGWATAFRKYSDAYAAAEDAAKAARAGIWDSDFQTPEQFRGANPRSEPRTLGFVARPGLRSAPATSSGCVIKGNHSRRGEWIYHLPGMPYYEPTRAEQMFCTEAEAWAAGYRRARVRK